MPSTASSITVIGAGVIGLSAAHELAAAGHQVTVAYDQELHECVSSVAAAIWFPYHSENSPAADQLLADSLARFEQLSENPETGIDLRRGLNVDHLPGADRSWTRIVAGTEEASPADLPDGAHAGVWATVPIITMSTYLGWLRGQVEALGVKFEKRTVGDLAELKDEADLVVLAAGLRGGELLGDDETVYPIRGQVVRLANTKKLTQWLCDDDYPQGVSYIIPRREDIIVGGTDTANDWNREVEPQTSIDILERAAKLVPELEGLEVLEHKVGLRPARETIRLDHVAGHPLPVIAAYGHGGAGVKLSWGTARRVVELAQQFSDL
ncbi:ABC transporter substrate-binding protein [Arthrobacter sp. YC-RL1]|uniref:FAD-dependent oxidoreductase n=1 Tax=Arthrobacter sp. YC-RL1 TaxID=1652545 RepID=UPI00063D9482|nr:FAD-dependent oxidoreductase [Arthrobacter sp. YC-RL1]ALQ30546.1 ABC transporter substrate-binding protein [Arthrobacter sp. YC-RL1]KLI88161.1 ABC transporter substrate-binding protein [Arthrobacter sp. YC-RL1]